MNAAHIATEPKSTPIIFSAPMIQAILEGRKTQTRRLVRGGPELHSRGRLLGFQAGVAKFGDALPDDPAPLSVRCPYGAPGDRLWVREAWSAIPAAPSEGRNRAHVAYRASCPDDEFNVSRDDSSIQRIRIERWSSPRYMPRASSRITLVLTRVRCKRLQALSDLDAIAEGVQPILVPTFPDGAMPTRIYEIEDAQFASARNAFAFAWDGINGERCEWDRNPFVWALTFARLT
jgi:hypothetical protein